MNISRLMRMTRGRGEARYHNDRPILLTGPTGYVGGCLLRALEHQGHRVRCLDRRPEFLKPKGSGSTEIVAGDVLDPAASGQHFGVSEWYYLIHWMGSAGSFEENDRQSARNFGAAAKAEGVISSSIWCVRKRWRDSLSLSI